MSCNCITEMDAQLAEHNTKLGVTFGFGRDGSSYTFPHLMTEKVERKVRKGPALAIPTFCPFCGVKYAPDKPVEPGNDDRPEWELSTGYRGEDFA